MENFIEMPTQHEIIGIAPETTINLCAGIPWDNGYKNIRLFNSLSELDAFLLSKTVKTEVNASPVKIGQLTVRLPYNEIEPLNCNYLYFSKNLPTLSSVSSITASVCAVERNIASN